MQPTSHRALPRKQMLYYLKSHTKLKLCDKHPVRSDINSVTTQMTEQHGGMARNT